MIGPSFRFRLERIRALRERSEDEAKLQLAGAMARRQECEQQVTAAAAGVLNARNAQLGSGTSSSTDLLFRQAYLERAESAHRSTLADLRRQEKEVAGRRSELTEASRDRQALEHLKAHRLADHQRESARLDAVALDEIAINGFRRRTAI
ncbi:MAG: flagellar export protein FliJ [Solirubrobacteraceae bacterium]|jgi:flagellar FliJ protein